MGGYLDTSFYRWEEPLRRIRFQFLCGKENLEETKALAARFTLPRRAERIKCPVLAVHGERDHGVPGDQAEKIVRGCAGEATSSGAALERPRCSLCPPATTSATT
jgi:pimeloyl-ACP methyl ester carboxylesterase